MLEMVSANLPIIPLGATTNITWM